MMFARAVTTTATLLSFAFWHVSTTSAFSFGAGGCFASQVSVASIHLRQMKMRTGALEDGNLTVLLDGKPLSTTFENSFTINEPHNLTLTTTSDDRFFRGFLIRLGEPDTPIDSSALAVPGDAAKNMNGTTTVSFIYPENLAVAQLAGSCLLHNASGIGHIDHSEKDKVTGVLMMSDARSGLRLDVTVVVRNRNHVSEFYYSGFAMNAKKSGSAILDWEKTTDWEKISFVVILLFFGGVLVAIIVRIVNNKRRRQGQTKYHEVSADKLADDEEAVDEAHIDLVPGIPEIS